MAFIYPPIEEYNNALGAMPRSAASIERTAKRERLKELYIKKEKLYEQLKAANAVPARYLQTQFDERFERELAFQELLRDVKKSAADYDQALKEYLA